MTDKEKLGYHKGALEALLNERAELARLLQIVNSLVEKHSKALEDMGVDVEKLVENIQNKKKEKAKKRDQNRQSKGRGTEDFNLSDEKLPE
ncbi:MAG: hypothetical protein ACLFTQ_02130 [Candidatus Aenigmatarchaeota archaeon]